MNRSHKNFAPALTSLFALSGVALLGLTACGQLPGFAADATTDKFAQTATLNDKIDILFVIDNSGSMPEEQDNLASSFSNFITAFSNKNLNFHIGVVSTDTINNNAYWGSTGPYTNGPYKDFPNAGPGSLLAYRTNARFLTPQTPDYVAQFRENVRLGVNGNGAETGILSLQKALSTGLTNAGQWNAGFVRDSAFLSVIVLSDEDEGVSATDSHYLRESPSARLARVNDAVSQLTTLKKGDSSLVRFDAIVARSLAECPTMYASYGLNGTGDVYMDLAARLNGKSANICRDFSGDLADLGADLVQKLSRFKLAQQPDGQIEVRVNGTLVPRDEFNGWEYLPDTKEVEFRGTAIPSANAEITVTYVPGAPLS